MGLFIMYRMLMRFLLIAIASGYSVLCCQSHVYQEFLKEQTRAHNKGYRFHNNGHDADKKFKDLNKKKIVGYDFLSQTELVLAKHFYDKIWHNYTQDPLVIDMCHHVIMKELEEQKKGRYTFVHGQPWQFNLSEEVYTTLWYELHNMPCNKYIFARFRKISLNEQELQKHIALRSNMMLCGRNNATYNKTGETVLCVNFGLFSNYSATNSFDYFLTSNYSRYFKFGLDYIFKQLNVEKYYHQFEQELHDLALEHAQLTSYGHILIFSIASDLVDKLIYPSNGFFNKDANVLSSHNVSTVKQLIDTLRTNPLSSGMDGYHFCLVLTKDCALIPNNGLDVYEFNAVDKTAMDAFQKKKKTLMDTILVNIKWDMAKEPTELQKNIQAIVAKVQLWKKHQCLLPKDSLWNQYLHQQLNNIAAF